jgi:hypothetical protein
VDPARSPGWPARPVQARRGGAADGVTGISYTGPASTYTLTTAQRNEALVLKNKLANYNQDGGC